MGAVRINISLTEEIMDELAVEVGPRERSRFIREAIRNFIQTRREQRLAAEYREAAEEIRSMDRELSGVLHDGLSETR